MWRWQRPTDAELAETPPRCVFCGARSLPDGRGGRIWAVTMATPADCEHEALCG